MFLGYKWQAQSVLERQVAFCILTALVSACLEKAKMTLNLQAELKQQVTFHLGNLCTHQAGQDTNTLLYSASGHILTFNF